MIIEISTTCGSKEEAKRIAEIAVTRRLCACVHISEIESYYRWQDAVHNGHEYKLSFKTIHHRYPDIADLIKREHSYELPALFATPVSSGNENYLQWIKDNSSHSPA